MVKFVWVKFINVHLVNRKHKACMLAGIAHSLHTEGKKNGLLFSFITPCLYEALIFTLGSFLFPLFLWWWCTEYFLLNAEFFISVSERASQEQFRSLCFASWSCPNSATSIHTWSMSGCLKTATESLRLVCGPCWALQPHGLVQIETRRISLIFFLLVVYFKLALPAIIWGLSIQQGGISLLLTLTAISPIV